MTDEERKAEFLRIARRIWEIQGLEEERRLEVEILTARFEQLKKEQTEAARKRELN